MDNLKFDDQGLVTVVVQDVRTGEVRMVAHADAAAVHETKATGLATFFSRSRGERWVKGQSSGNTIRVDEIYVDCNRDALIYLGVPSGPSCHTGEPSCFFARADQAPSAKPARPWPTLARLYETLEDRNSSSEDKSYTKKLLSRGPELIGAKLREEAGELADAVTSESDERVVSEAADVLYHLWVGLLSRGVKPDAVSEELSRRFNQSGLQEKASRSS